jgi:hypothetical protein
MPRLAALEPTQRTNKRIETNDSRVASGYEEDNSHTFKHEFRITQDASLDRNRGKDAFELISVVDVLASG